jgi:hypothetical protein
VTVSYILLNAFSMADALFSTMTVSVSNFWSKSDASLGDDKVPVIIKIKGTLADNNQVALALFFDAVTPIYENPYSE